MSSDVGSARRSRRRKAGVTLFVIAALTGATAVGFAVTGGGEEEPDLRHVVAGRATSAAALGGTANADRTISIDVLAEDAEIASAISRAPWSDPDGARDRRLERADDLGALAFPAGTSYAEAATQLFMAAVAGRAPRSAHLVEALPEGVVAALPATDRGQVVLDLRAPFGYLPDDDGGIILGPSVGFDPGESLSDVAGRPWRRFGRAGWPRGGRLVPVILPPCMRMTTTADAPATRCTPADQPLQDLTLLKGPRLP